MPGRTILTASAVLLFLIGAAALFAPEEAGTILFGGASPGQAIAFQLAAAGLLGFAVMNWMSRRNRIGGIYARPLGLGNLRLFAVDSLSIGRGAASGALPTAALALAALLGLAALAFAWLVLASDPLADPASS